MKKMKKMMILITMFTLSATAFAQYNGMMNNRGYHNEYSNGNNSFSTVEMLLGAILLVLIIAVLMWFFNNNKKAKGYASNI